ncbi:MAG: DUF1223 domain-containing protein [Hyphomicrobiales bacterium]|jgi:hypothetical protein|nr:DUF1223 domain-containing protein [Hyphomicrobiales bacterium]
MKHPLSTTLTGLLLAVCLSGTALSQAPQAEHLRKPRAVLELFTSQGCSSCPAADALFVELARDPGLLVLTLPVDYWDYLGWKDTLAHAAFTQRQRGYAKSRGDGQIYTPQAVIDGVAHTVASDRQAMMQIISAHQSTPLPLDVAVSEAAGQIKVSVSGTAGSGSIWLLTVARFRSVVIQRGENRGREVSYANVVRSLMRIGDWRGAPMSLDLPASLARQADAETYVVLIHSDAGKVGRVIGAGKAPGF